MALEMDPLLPFRLVGYIVFKGVCVLFQDIICGGIDVVVHAETVTTAWRVPVPYDSNRAYGLWRLACCWAEPWLDGFVSVVVATILPVINVCDEVPD